MQSSRYETHKISNLMLPFIYHRRFDLTQLQKYPNWHENIELLQCTEGSGYVLCSAEKLPLSPEALVVVNADTLHSIGTDNRVVFRCLIIDNSFFSANGVPIGSLYFESIIRDKAVLALYDRVAAAYEALDNSDYRSILAIRSRILQLMEVLCRDHTVQQPDTPSNTHVKNAMIYLRQNLSAPISLDRLADAVGISKFHLARQFKLFTGKTVVQALNLMRCTEARRLIEEGTPVSAAAATCGFENLSYFTRSFKKHLGVLPSACIPNQHTATPSAVKND